MAQRAVPLCFTKNHCQHNAQTQTCECPNRNHQKQTPQSDGSRHPGQHLPQSDGSRHCVGWYSKRDKLLVYCVSYITDFGLCSVFLHHLATCSDCDECPGKHYVCERCGKVTKKPDHMVSHLQMCRRKNAPGSVAPDVEQLEAPAGAGKLPGVCHCNSPHLGCQQDFGWVVKDENGTMSSWRLVTNRCPGALYEPAGVLCCTWNLHGTTTCIVLTKTGPQVYNIQRLSNYSTPGHMEQAASEAGAKHPQAYDSRFRDEVVSRMTFFHPPRCSRLEEQQ